MINFTQSGVLRKHYTAIWTEKGTQSHWNQTLLKVHVSHKCHGWLFTDNESSNDMQII